MKRKAIEDKQSKRLKTYRNRSRRELRRYGQMEVTEEEILLRSE